MNQFVQFFTQRLGGKLSYFVKDVRNQFVESTVCFSPALYSLAILNKCKRFLCNRLIIPASFIFNAWSPSTFEEVVKRGRPMADWLSPSIIMWKHSSASSIVHSPALFIPNSATHSLQVSQFNTLTRVATGQFFTSLISAAGHSLHSSHFSHIFIFLILVFLACFLQVAKRYNLDARWGKSRWTIAYSFRSEQNMSYLLKMINGICPPAAFLIYLLCK